MHTVYSPDHTLRNARTELYGGELVRPFECLERADFIHYGGVIADLKLPTLFVMEGGYAVEEIGVNTINVLTGFEGA